MVVCSIHATLAPAHESIACHMDTVCHFDTSEGVACSSCATRGLAVALMRQCGTCATGCSVAVARVAFVRHVWRERSM